MYTSRLEPWSDVGRRGFEVRVDPASLVGVSDAFGSCLVIPVNIETPQLGGPHLLTLGGWLQPVTGRPFGGIPIPQQPVVINETYLQIPLSPRQIAQMELSREGNDLSIHIRLRGTASLPVGDMATAGHVVQAVADSGLSGFSMLVPRETWLKVLADLGGPTIKLVELAAPPLPRGRPQWEECVRLLDEAATATGRAEYEAAVQSCRKVVEGLVSVIGDAWNIDAQTPFKTWVESVVTLMTEAWPSDRASARLLGSLLHTTWGWTSGAHHFGSTLPERNEALFMVSLTANLLELAASLLATHPTGVSVMASASIGAAPLGAGTSTS